jgi:hypothetical protein
MIRFSADRAYRASQRRASLCRCFCDKGATAQARCVCCSSYQLSVAPHLNWLIPACKFTANGPMNFVARGPMPPKMRLFLACSTIR